MTRNSIFGGLFLSLSACAANAGDNWSGFYVGIDGGVAQTTAEAYSIFADANGASQDIGGVVGFSAGYDQQFGDFVLGGVADISLVGTDDLYFGGKTDAANYDLNAVATARVRAGFAVNNQLLMYGTGGLAVSFIDATLIEPLPSSRAGYVVGFGSEYRLTSNLSIKTEFLHHKFDDYTSMNSLVPAGASLEDPIALQSDSSLKSSLNTVKIGLNYRF